jgi:hypothetical protein
VSRQLSEAASMEACAHGSGYPEKKGDEKALIQFIGQ